MHNYITQVYNISRSSHWINSDKKFRYLGSCSTQFYKRHAKSRRSLGLVVWNKLISLASAQCPNMHMQGKLAKADTSS